MRFGCSPCHERQAILSGSGLDLQTSNGTPVGNLRYRGKVEAAGKLNGLWVAVRAPLPNLNHRRPVWPVLTARLGES